MDKLERLKKYANGGKVAKLQEGNKLTFDDLLAGKAGLSAYMEAKTMQLNMQNTNVNNQDQYGNAIIKPTENDMNALVAKYGPARNDAPAEKLETPLGFGQGQQGTVSMNTSKMKLGENGQISGAVLTQTNSDGTVTERQLGQTAKPKASNIEGNAGWTPTIEQAQMIGGAAIAAINAVDGVTMGDKNFSASSQAIDTTVHGVSGALMKSGNPYAMCCLRDTIVFTAEGKPILIQDIKKEDGILGYYNKQIIAQPIEELFNPLIKESLLIETEGGVILRCSTDHPIYSALEGRAKYFTVAKKKQRRIKEFSFRRADELKIGDFVAEAGDIPFFGNKHVKLAYLIGMLIGDGTYGNGSVPRLFTGDSCTWKWLEENNLGKLTTRHYPGERYSKEFREYSFNGIQNLLREHGIYGQTKKNKRLPSDLYQWDKESCAALIAGLFDTDGFVESDSKQHAGISLSQSNIDLLKQVKLLLLKFGIHCAIHNHPAKNKCIKSRIVCSKETYVLNIKTRESVINFYNNISLNIDYKQKSLHKAYLLKLGIKSRDTSIEFHNIHADKIKRIISLGLCEVYNLRAGISHTYLAEGIVTHNTAGVALEGLNFATKAAGKNVQGYNVDINNSGYGNLGYQDSEAGRVWDTWSGTTSRKLAKRNEQARMALAAADISQSQQFQQEARANSVTNILQQNQIALAGGIDTSLLGS